MVSALTLNGTPIAAGVSPPLPERIERIEMLFEFGP